MEILNYFNILEDFSCYDIDKNECDYRCDGTVNYCPMVKFISGENEKPTRSEMLKSRKLFEDTRKKIYDIVINNNLENELLQVFNPKNKEE